MDIEKLLATLVAGAILGGVTGLMGYGFYWGLGVFVGWPELDARHVCGIITLCAIIGACLGGGDHLYWHASGWRWRRRP